MTTTVILTDEEVVSAATNHRYCNGKTAKGLLDEFIAAGGVIVIKPHVNFTDVVIEMPDRTIINCLIGLEKRYLLLLARKGASFR